jgi:hypothetical protein
MEPEGCSETPVTVFQASFCQNLDNFSYFAIQNIEPGVERLNFWAIA